MLPENFARGPAHFFDSAPDHIRDALREDVRGQVADNMRIAGLGRHAPHEIVELGTRSLSALSMLLGWKPYLMGDRPCGLDAAAFGALAGLMTPFFDSPLRDRSLEYANLVVYVDRMMAQYYPEHDWQRLAKAA
jgi:glutathione S-transferase